MGKQFTVVGTGTVPSKAITESLIDVLEEGDSVGFLWTGKPTEGQETVYDYVLDNEIYFVMYHEDGTNPPRVFRESEFGVVQKSRDPLAKALEDTTGSVLVLWDDVDQDFDELIGTVWDSVHPAGINLLELTNGLTPIVLEEEPEEVTQAKVEAPVEEEDEDDEDDTTYSKDELEVMQAAVVKRYGARLGLEGTTKKAIIDELFPTLDVEEVTDDDVEAEEVEVVKAPAGNAGRLEQDIDDLVNMFRVVLTRAATGYYN